MAGPLTGFTILDLTWGISGPLATMLMADNGADVVRVSPPSGEPFEEHPGYVVWNRGKKSITLDLRAPAGLAALHRLLVNADAFVESFQPGVAAGLGLGYDGLHERYPRLVYTSISGYGQEGSDRGRPGYDGLVQARLGLQEVQQGYRPGPIYVGFAMSSYSAAFLAVIGTLTALAARERTGRGQHVDTSLRDGALAMLTMHWRQSEKGQERFAVPAWKKPLLVEMFKCSDGWLHLHTGAQGAFPRLMEGVGLHEYASTPMTAESWQVMLAKARAWFAARPRDEALAILRRQDVPSLPILPPGGALRDPQSAVMKFVEKVRDPRLGDLEEIGLALRFEKTPGAIRGSAPRPGEHTDEVLAAASVPPSRVGKGARGLGPNQAGGEASHPLTGLKIVDFGIFFAGPYAPKMLADMGASVIKVEALTGDPLRRTAGAFSGAQRNKRCIALDLKSPEGRAIAHRLMADADMVCHNMRPGVAERLGIDYETAKRLRPNVIYLYSPAFGTEGPRADQPGFEPLVSGLVGIEANCGGSGNDPVTTLGNMDYGNGLLGACGLLMALLHRSRTGEGQYIECPQMVSGMVTTSEVYFRPDGSLSDQYELDREQTGYGPLCRLYETKEGWLCVVAATDKQYSSLCSVLGAPHLCTDRRFSSRGPRRTNGDALAAELSARFKSRTAQEWQKMLDATGVPCEVSISGGMSKLLNDPEHLASGLVAEYPHPQYGRLREVGLTIRLSETPGTLWAPAPLIGQHTREILAELGYSQDDQERLKRTGVVNWAAEEPAKASPV